MPKRAEQVARRIEADIAKRGWPVGKIVGAESELLRRYGVSRAVLREAVRLLEQNHVARMRRGPGGGLVVEASAASGASQAMATYFAFARLTPAELGEARRAVDGTPGNEALAIFAAALDRAAVQGSFARPASRLAEAIGRDLRAESCTPGETIASEGALLDRHGVSRAVFREAIRILERNGVASMRRGPGGGLVVGRCEPDRVLEVVSSYLLYAGLDRRVLSEAREVLRAHGSDNRALDFFVLALDGAS